jgi:hypothetical protein
MRHSTERFTGRRKKCGIEGPSVPVIGGTGAGGIPAVPELPKRDENVRIKIRTF